jgi:hypothetical protein
LVSIPPNETVTAAIVHQTTQTSQNYSLSHSSVGGQSSSGSFTFTDTRQFNENWNQTITSDISNSNYNFGGINDLTSVRVRLHHTVRRQGRLSSGLTKHTR